MFSSGPAAPERGTAVNSISRSDSADGRQSDGPDRAGASWSAIPWGVVGMVALIIGFETFVGRNWLDFSDPVSLSWRYRASSVPKASSERAILCLGDSLIKHGLIPGVIEQETGRKTVNLSAARAPTLLTYFLLRRRLTRALIPRPSSSMPSPRCCWRALNSMLVTGRRCSRRASASTWREWPVAARLCSRRSWVACYPRSGDGSR